MRINETLSIAWQPVLGGLARTMREKGFSVRRTFDLQLARQSLKDNEEAQCPHHGAARCTCQYLVLQIASPGRSPSAVVIHGHDEMTRIVLLPAAGEEADGAMAAAICEALEHVQTTGTARRRASIHHVVARDRESRRGGNT